ncbi:MAG: type II toxin-antitoxin system HicA family toxin [Chloroflexi bacterium]|nr:type II toxin-antitoxin system HicA family toxin [Chloroflexota bacterium]MBU1750341.1 type II toxin-antitoxin system HicA family toxin [Chloroflexota bacterium]
MKIRDVLNRLREDGWYVARQRGSHRVLKHAVRKGIVVVAGHPSKELAPGTLKSTWKQAGLEDER